MRLKSIEIENITSLMGKHFIDFEEILKEGELFAITGATGSGKSSILSAISLALYGKNYKKNLDSKDFVSLGAAIANVKLHFETRGDAYIAHWSLKVLKKNGDPVKKPSPQRIVTKNGVAVEETPEEIIGLTFEQFTRSVVLNQGQFSKFLVSNFSERRKILERLYSENELSEINKKLRENVNSQKQEIELLTIKLDSSLPYTEVEIIEAEKALPSLKQQRDQKEKEMADLQEMYSQLKDIIEFSSKRIQFGEKKIVLQKDLTALNERVNQTSERLREKSTELEVFKKRYTIESAKLQKAISVRNKIENLQERELSLKDKEKRQLIKLNELKEQETIKKNECTDLEKLKESLRKDSPLSKLSEDDIDNLEEQASCLLSLQSDQKVYLENKATKEKELTEIEQLGKKLKQQLEQQQELKYNIFKDENPELFITQSLEKIEQNLAKGSREILISEQAKIRQVALKKDLDLIQVEKTQELTQQSKEKLAKFESDFQKSLNEEKTIKKNELLIGLIDESILKNSCALCHQDSNIESFKEIKKDLVTTLSNIQGVISSSSIQELLSKESEKHAILKHQEREKIESAKKISQQITELDQDVQKSPELLKIEEQLKKQKEELHLKAKELRELEQNTIITEEKTNALREDFRKCKAVLLSLDQTLNTHDDSIRQSVQNISKIAKKEFTTSDIDNLKNDIKQTKEFFKVENQLENTRSLHQSTLKQVLHLKETKQELESELLETSKELIERTAELQELTIGIDVDTAIKELEKERESLEISLKEIAKNKSDTETEYTRVLTSVDSLKDQITVLENSIMSALGNISSLKFKGDSLVSGNKETEIFLEKLMSLKSYPETAETIQGLSDGLQRLLTSELSKFKEYISETISTITKYSEKINLYRTKEAEQTNDKALLNELTTSYNRLNNLIDVLGRNKDEFRNFVLGFIEQQLIQNTNLELEKICDGRFALIQRESTHGHDFFIADRWNGSMERKVTTLSGGETFLVSLAMALTLAEMTRGQVDIDCFFIDEGFGSLDTDSIEDAFSALMSVRSRGKQIGIISHIKELTSRIPANINLVKSPEGHSKIEYLYN